MYTYICDFFVCFRSLSLRTSTFSQNAKYVDTGRPSGTCGRGLSSIRALKLAWRVLRVFFPAGVDKAISRGFSTTLFFSSFIRFFCFFCGEIMTQRQATAAAVHRACYNQLTTTFQRCRAQQQHATPCACDRSALYRNELLWKAPEIRHPSHLLVPGISRLLLSLFCFVRHKTQIQHTTIAAVQRARYSQHPCRAQQQQTTPCACGRYALYSV